MSEELNNIVPELDNITTFVGLISKLGIKIPLIQRDYVQGRVHDAEIMAGGISKDLLNKYITEQERRDNFVNQLIAALNEPDEKSIRLTFIYGTCEEEEMEGSNRHKYAFVPLDGQQRLTTLFLLLWLLVNKVFSDGQLKIDGVTDEDISGLKKGIASFCYQTRPSSGAFLSSLATKKITRGEGEISKQLKEQSWFGDEWVMDPSVQAMLQMLDKIDSVLGGKAVNVKRMLENLISGKGISFDLLNMKDYRLTDGLYIKMNARGKQLSEFENWKSEFIDFLGKHHKDRIYERCPKPLLDDEFQGNKPSLVEYFKYSIEHQWTDLFWKYCKNELDRYDKCVEQNRDHKDFVKDCYPVIDRYFMNWFKKITQIFFFENNPEKNNSSDYNESKKAIREGVFSKEENVVDFFVYLDILCGLGDDWFDKVFYYSPDNQETLRDGRIRLFDNRSINLLTRCATKENGGQDDSTAESDTLLYSILKYIKEFGSTVDNDMLSYVRQVRNRIERVRTLKKNSSMVMQPDYFIHDICKGNQGSVSKFIDTLIRQKKEVGNLEFHRSKHEAAIEDFDFIRGNKELVVEGCSAEKVYEVLKAWDALEVIKKQQLLIAYGFSGHLTTNCNHGQLCLWGGEDKWESIFVHDDGNGNGNIDDAVAHIVSDYYKLAETPNFVSSGGSGERECNVLEELLRAKKSEHRTFGFAYYALKYDAFLQSHASGKNAQFYLSVKGAIDNLDLISASYGGRPTLGYHTDPIVFTLKDVLINKSGSVDASAKECFLSYSIQGENRACLVVYDSKDALEPAAIFRHKSGRHTEGGWELLKYEKEKYLNEGDLIKKCDDIKDQDRICAGAEFVKSEIKGILKVSNVKFSEK